MTLDQLVRGAPIDPDPTAAEERIAPPPLDPPHGGNGGPAPSGGMTTRPALHYRECAARIVVAQMCLVVLASVAPPPGDSPGVHCECASGRGLTGGDAHRGMSSGA